MRDIVRLHASSGTTGKPIVVAYTQADVNVWTDAIVRTLVCYGIHAGDVVQNAYGYGLFTGGLGLHYGAEALGATVIPISGGNTDRQINGDEGFWRFGDLLHAQLLSPPDGPCGGDRRRPPPICRCGWAASGPSRGPTPCAAASRRRPASRPSTCTA